MSEGSDLEYRLVIMDFINWCGLNHLQLNTSKTKEEIVFDFKRETSPHTPVNILGLDIETVDSFKYLGVPVQKNGHVPQHQNTSRRRARVAFAF